jgi:hypothetical protein
VRLMVRVRRDWQEHAGTLRELGFGDQ